MFPKDFKVPSGWTNCFGFVYPNPHPIFFQERENLLVCNAIHIVYDFSPQLLLIMHQFLLDVGELGIELIVLGLLCGGQVAVLCHEKHLTAKVVRCHMPPGEVLSENVIIPK